MAVYLSALLAVLTPAAGLQPQPDSPRARAAKKELQHFQGTWQFESLEENGKKAPAADLKERTFFVGANVFMVRRGNTILQAGELQVDPAKTPKTVNALVKLGQHKGEVMLGIYTLDGDTLKVCLDIEGQERPKEFKTTPGSQRLLAVYKRLRPKGEQVDITGAYRSESIQEDGTRYTAEAIIERVGNAYTVTYRKGPVVAYVAVGIRQGDTFSMAWVNQGQVGVTLYRIEEGPRLVGQYTHLGGVGLLSQETLTRAKKMIDVRLR
ncbi:MAG: TIGR03067 domain-containing protein [Gemmataceae bacterium]|nr:TIGR03067 domain-containing protein [Gemmataceae bacterium]